MVLSQREQRSDLTRAVASRRAAAQVDAYAAELDALIDAAFAVVAETGSLDPPVRQILRTAGLSNAAFYRHVEGKDELLLLMLDRGRHELVAYLDRLVAACDEPTGRLRVWIDGVMAQARDEDAARRTRPFIAQADRLAELFPDEQQRSEQLLIDQLAASTATGPAAARAVYDVVFAALARHLRRGTSADDVELDTLARIAAAILTTEEQP
ncbi:MAG: TetR/AcrR family transcriptional regulator [Actinomycetota bacterium]